MLNYTKIEERIQHTVNYLLCMRQGRTMKNDTYQKKKMKNDQNKL
jgi:hypothetical protein